MAATAGYLKRTGNRQIEQLHNRNAPYWAAGLVVLCLTGLATVWIDGGTFWKGYLLDITGPAWNYILFRALFREYKDTPWRRFFRPGRTLLFFLIVCAAIETAQYLELYDATYDPLDFLAYVSLLIPLFILDLIQTFRGQARTHQKVSNPQFNSNIQGEGPETSPGS